MLLHLSPYSLLFAPKQILDSPFGKDWDQKEWSFLILKTGLSQSSVLTPFLGSLVAVIPFGLKITLLPSFPEMEFVWSEGLPAFEGPYHGLPS